MGNYTLHYFNLRAKAELTRLVFAAAGVKYVDHRMNGQEWQEFKPKAPTGQLPCMEIEIDGKTVWLGQSIAISRYVAKEHGLSGENNMENARADSVVDTTVDMFAELLKKYLEKDDAKKAEIQKKLDSEIFPKYLNTFEKLLATNPSGPTYFVGKKLTWADLAVFNVFFFPLKNNSKLMEGYPKLKTNRETVSQNSRIAEYLKNRPEASM